MIVERSAGAAAKPPRLGARGYGCAAELLKAKAAGEVASKSGP